jgi:hypothetical protein
LLHSSSSPRTIDGWSRREKVNPTRCCRAGIGVIGAIDIDSSRHTLAGDTFRFILHTLQASLGMYGFQGVYSRGCKRDRILSKHPRSLQCAHKFITYHVPCLDAVHEWATTCFRWTSRTFDQIFNSLRRREICKYYPPGLHIRVNGKSE